MEDFVSYELAKKLKEKGFKEKCYKHYYPNSKDWFISSSPECGNYSSYLDAPTISQVLKWLREKKKINVNMRLFVANGWYFTIQNYKGEPIYSQLTNTDDLYSSYEQAALVGIEYCLDNLI